MAWPTWTRQPFTRIRRLDTRADDELGDLELVHVAERAAQEVVPAGTWGGTWHPRLGACRGTPGARHPARAPPRPQLARQWIRSVSRERLVPWRETAHPDPVTALPSQSTAVQDEAAGQEIPVNPLNC